MSAADYFSRVAPKNPEAEKSLLASVFVHSRIALDAITEVGVTADDFYFEPQYEEFRARTLWSLSNAFTSAFKELDPIPQFKATAKLSGFLEERFARKF